MAGWLFVDDRPIKELTDEGLRVLVRELIWSAAATARCDLRGVSVNVEGKAGDGGADGNTPVTGIDSAWLPNRETCWQLKAGDAGEPARLEGEIGKPVPSRVLRAGGAFVLIASRCASGTAGIEARKKKLADEASALGLPTEHIHVYDADKLHRWIVATPAAALALTGVSDAGVFRVDEWARLPEHDAPFTATPAITRALAELTATLDLPLEDASAPLVVAVHGQHGAGKSRFVLEAVRKAGARSLVVYLPESSVDQIRTIGAHLRRHPIARIIVVADEALDPAIAKAALDEARVSGGRGRFVLIGPDLRAALYGAERTVAIRRDELGREELEAVVIGWHSGMPREHVDFVVRLAEGNVRLARMIAGAIARGGVATTDELLRQPDISGLLEEILGKVDARALMVVAVADSVGWNGDVEAEGKLIASALDLNWGDVRVRVEEADRKSGVAPRAGNRRYISPTPLGLYLAGRTWDVFAPRLRELMDGLPEPGRTALHARFESLGRHPKLAKLAREEVERYRTLDDFHTGAAARFWRTLAKVEPARAVERLHGALERSTVEARRSLDPDARRELVWALDWLSWPTDTFRHSIRCLAFLAEAETEEFASNATGTFVSRFQIILGGTAVPYEQRLRELEPLWAGDSVARRVLVVKALSAVGTLQAIRNDSGATGQQAQEPEWQPATRGARRVAVETGIGELCRYAANAPPELSDAFVQALQDCSSLLHAPVLLPSVRRLVERVIERFPSVRERTRRLVQQVITVRGVRTERDEEGDAASYVEHTAALRALHESLRDTSLMGRLVEFVGRPRFDENETLLTEQEALAREFISRTAILSGEPVQWLTSGEAQDAWQFGRVMGRLDAPEFTLWPIVRDATTAGADTRLSGGYLSEMLRARGSDEVDDELDHLRSGNDRPAAVFNLTLRLPPTDRGGRRVLDLLGSGQLEDRAAAFLQYGTWADELSEILFLELVAALASKATLRPLALVVLAHRRRRKRVVLSGGLRELALDLLGDRELLTGGSDLEHSWAELAEELVADETAVVGRAILDAHRHRVGDRIWFVAHSQTAPVLLKAVQAQPRLMWEEIAARLDAEGYAFTIGLPETLVPLVPAELILEWVRAKPETRAHLIAQIVPLRNLDDDSLAARLIDEFGGMNGVGSAFAGAYQAGGWVGRISAYIEGLRSAAATAAKKATRPGYRSWLERLAADLADQVEREREREAEEDILLR